MSNGFDPYQLRVIGTDRATVTPITTDKVDYAKLPAYNDQLLPKAGESLQKGYQSLSTTLQQEMEMNRQLTQDAIARSDARVAAAYRAADVAGRNQQTASQNLAGIAQTLYNQSELEFRKKETKKKELQQRQANLKDVLKKHVMDRQKAQFEKEKAQQQVNFTVSYGEMQDLVNSAPSIIAENGATYYRQKVRETVTARDVSPEDTVKLMQYGNGPLEAISSKYNELNFDNAQKMSGHLVDQSVALLKIKNSGVLARIVNTEADITPLLQEYDSNFQKFAEEHPELDGMQLSAIRAESLQELEKSVRLSADKHAQVEAKINNSQAFMNELAPYYEAKKLGEIGPNEYAAIQYQLSQKYSIPIETARELSDPYAVEKEYEENLKTRDNIYQLQSQGVARDLNTVEVTNQWIGHMAYTLAETPGALESAKKNPRMKDIRAYQQAFGVAEEYKEFKQKEIDLRQRKIQKTKELAALDEQIVRFENSNDPKVAADYKEKIKQMFGYEAPGDLSDDAKTSIRQTYDLTRNSILEEIANIDNEYLRAKQRLEPYGLHQGKQSHDQMYAKYRATIDQTNTLMNSVPQSPKATTPGANPNFSSGRASGVAMKRLQVESSSIITPFRADAQVTVTDRYGGTGSPRHGRNRPHGGIDLAAPAGTPVIAIIGGEVVNKGFDPAGYGNYVDIRGDDGVIQRFAHMEGKSYVVEGQRVQPNQVIGRVGSTGNSRGPHLHWEFRRDVNGGFENTVDPELEAARLNQGYGTVRPRGSSKGWEVTYNPYEGGHPNNINPIPADAKPLMGGFYIRGDKIYDRYGKQPARPVNNVYHNGNPIRNSYEPIGKDNFSAARDNTPDKNYGYAVLARDKEARKALSEIATDLGIPAIWIADIVQYESGWEPNADNGVGYSGLIQVGDAAASELGYTRHEIMKMSRADQLRKVVKPYLQKFGTARLKTIEHVLAAIWGGDGFLRRIEKDPKKADAVSDGNITWGEYKLGLGRHAGRQYATTNSSRARRVAKVIHEKYTSGCTVCNQLVASNSSLIPHEGQFVSGQLDIVNIG
ncbi:peptidoglycan DD-metalloendopeptidase family protein [Chroococcidiopsis sp. CCNUC1]|uniref:peptidoglycan DD-metalloendopeptidase family protein n=1 Tax=Chroococcidiopsis sp. CCNUC1 TaxID=2653189 RepID=UPI0020217A04|nr:peptidoglycan DD-metalloendopeptidase family protein [Chroococcidiopsis sp. CCNUC1]URD50745.1 M23 family metallopeptidase [Chroococcidiopsis sp. CCNUC1]